MNSEIRLKKDGSGRAYEGSHRIQLDLEAVRALVHPSFVAFLHSDFRIRNLSRVIFSYLKDLVVFDSLSKSRSLQ